VPLIATAAGWQYAFLALAAGPVTGLAALAGLNRLLRPEQPALTITERTSP